jgi:hypothetical protein
MLFLLLLRLMLLFYVLKFGLLVVVNFKAVRELKASIIPVLGTAEHLLRFDGVTHRIEIIIIIT